MSNTITRGGTQVYTGTGTDHAGGSITGNMITRTAGLATAASSARPAWISATASAATALAVLAAIAKAEGRS